MPATLVLRDKTYEVKSGMTVRHCLEKAGILPESVLVTRQGELLTEDVIVNDGDELKLVSVISGGSQPAGGTC